MSDSQTLLDCRCYDSAVPVAEKDFNVALGGRVRRCRELRGYSQARVADLVGVPRTSLILMERGEQRISAYTLNRLSTVLEVEIKVLLAGEELAADASVPGLPPAAPAAVREFVTSVRRAAGSTQRRK